MKKKIVWLSAGVITVFLGAGAALYLFSAPPAEANMDYVCRVDTSTWGFCEIYSCTDWIGGSRTCLGLETQTQNLVYGNSRQGCTGQTIFDSEITKNQALLKDHNGNIVQTVDLKNGGEVLTQSLRPKRDENGELVLDANGNTIWLDRGVTQTVSFNPVSTRACSITETDTTPPEVDAEATDERVPCVDCE